MAYMYTGLNDCFRIARGPGVDFTRAELESAVRVMTGEVFSPESLVLPSGVKALCEDQALRSSILAAMPTLDEGGLAVRQLGGDRNRGLQIPGATPDRQQRASEVRLPPEKEKRRRRCRSTGARAMRVLPRPKGATRPRGRRPHRVAEPKGASPGGSSVATAP
jgi:hypothetical protein